MNSTVKYRIKFIFSRKPWNDHTLTADCLPVALCLSMAEGWRVGALCDSISNDISQKCDFDKVTFVGSMGKWFSRSLVLFCTHLEAWQMHYNVNKFWHQKVPRRQSEGTQQTPSKHPGGTQRAQRHPGAAREPERPLMQNVLKPFWNHVKPIETKWNHVKPSEAKWNKAKWQRVKPSATTWSPVTSTEIERNQVKPSDTSRS